MNAERISEIERLLPLAEKYGLAVLLVFILLIIVLKQWRDVATGKLVPREMLDRALEDNDRLQEILDGERKEFMQPMLEVFRRLKTDHHADNEEDRGG
ncbi:hypothetical protein GCM10010912_17470 [Paenibacillus albidus]|uniref:Uncharacterized protein n=1 Tax=Paenibacillus albidus TaxID=2041023 RepID=A0A917C589_9BACL|nr:hypothetical protein [Paenibacillus albidus]GGF72764.1 hypothetical protein GCM10010912_17470 [Paenibacillus albidus]